jgi:hypothetical protein
VELDEVGAGANMSVVGGVSSRGFEDMERWAAQRNELLWLGGRWSGRH